jgi:hypothetical protein
MSFLIRIVKVFILLMLAGLIFGVTPAPVAEGYDMWISFAASAALYAVLSRMVALVMVAVFVGGGALTGAVIGKDEAIAGACLGVIVTLIVTFIFDVITFNFAHELIYFFPAFTGMQAFILALADTFTPISASLSSSSGD